MRGRRRSSLVLVAALALLAGCTHGREDPTPDPRPDGPPARTTWALRHRVVESADLHVISSGVSPYDESTGVSLRQDPDESCYVSVSAPGQGGPDNRVGQKLSATFRGRPAVRNGAGAEGPYLMWQLADGSWVEVACDEPASIDVAARAVRLTRSSIALPFALSSLPEGYRVAQIMQDRRSDSTDLYVGRVQPEIGLPDSDLQVTLDSRDETLDLSGRAVTVGGLPGVLSEDPEHPVVCVSVQARQACVGITPSDTGPYPDRSADVPTLLAIADRLHYATDLADRSTWFAAETVFG